MQRAVDHHAYGFAALERIISHQATPKPGWQQLDEGSQEALVRLSSSEPIGSRQSQEYQHLLDGFSTSQGNQNDETGQANTGETDHPTPESLSLLYKVVAARNGRGSTAFITNVDFSQWTEYLGDPPLVMALLDRVVDGAITIRFDGKSYRQHRAEQKRSKPSS